jgi:hypothetical protein
VDRQLYCYDYVEETLERIEAVLEEGLEALLQPATDVAARHGQEVLARLRVPIGGFEIGREIRIRIGELEHHDDRRVVLPLTWESLKATGMFPHMEARLEVAALSDEPAICQVMFFGSYVPPAGAVGAIGDSLAMHRVAEASVHRFLGDVVARLRSLLASSDNRDAAGPSDE